jgi:hypothetical protein
MTDEPDNGSEIFGLIGKANLLESPLVAAVRSVIRSGDQFMIGGQTEQLPGRSPSQGLQPVSPFIGGIVVEWGFDVEPEFAPQFHRWLLDNEGELRVVTPPRCHYWGTYAVFAQSNLSLGAYRTVWAYESLDALTVMDASVSSPNARFSVLIAELTSFRDLRIGAGRSQQIYQPAAMTTRI